MRVNRRCACQLATVRFDNDAMESVYRIRNEVIFNQQSNF